MDDPQKNPGAVELGRRGGLARAKNLSHDQIKDIGRQAAAVRWKDHKPSVPIRSLPKSRIAGVIRDQVVTPKEDESADSDHFTRDDGEPIIF